MMRFTLLFAVIAALALAAPAAAQSPAGALPQAPGVSPPGANDPSCRPTAERPYPVILVHGTFEDMTGTWNTVSPALRRDGFCVFALDLVRRGAAPIDESADKLAAFVDEVLAATGAAKVSLLGHSQGGLLSRYVVRFRGKLERVDDVIGLAPSTHGTDSPLAAPAAVLLDCPACAEQRSGSPFLVRANAGPDEAPAPVDYTVVSTRYDQVVTPFQTQALRVGANVTNVVLQDRCPQDATEHVGIVYDPVALEWTRNALNRPGPADPAFVPDCSGLRPSAAGPGQVGQATPAPAAAPPASAPVLRLGARRVLRVRGGRARIAAHCFAAAPGTCTGRLELRAGSRRIGARSYRIAAGRRVHLRVALTRAARRTLARRGRLRASARANTARAGGGSVRAQRSVTLR